MLFAAAGLLSLEFVLAGEFVFAGGFVQLVKARAKQVHNKNDNEGARIGTSEIQTQCTEVNTLDQRRNVLLENESVCAVYGLNKRSEQW